MKFKEYIFFLKMSYMRWVGECNYIWWCWRGSYHKLGWI